MKRWKEYIDESMIILKLWLKQVCNCGTNVVDFTNCEKKLSMWKLHRHKIAWSDGNIMTVVTSIYFTWISNYIRLFNSLIPAMTENTFTQL